MPAADLAEVDMAQEGRRSGPQGAIASRVANLPGAWWRCGFPRHPSCLLWCSPFLVAAFLGRSQGLLLLIKACGDRGP